VTKRELIEALEDLDSDDEVWLLICKPSGNEEYRLDSIKEERIQPKILLCNK
jgi:hypothetical protein